ncbi:MAG: sulfatase/phosphatase domain-containing protein [Opitutaceae bacterium]
MLSEINAHTPGALVVYTADHGDMFFSHRLASKGPAIYDEVARIPLIVRWPERTAPGVTVPHPVSHIDLTPTFLEYFGIESPPLLQGESLVPVFSEPDRPLHDIIFIEFNRFEVDHDGFGAFAPIRCGFDGRYKLSINLLDTDELYDLELDPAELVNRIDDPACENARVRLHDAIIEWMNHTRDPLRGPHWACRPWRDLGGSTWGGPTRPRPFDPEFAPPTLLYDTAREIDRRAYDKG